MKPRTRARSIALQVLYENDIATLLHYYQPDTNALLGEISKYVNETDFEEIKGVVSDIQKRINRFKNESR